MTLGLDNGSAVTIIPENLFNDYPLLPNKQSRAGIGYRSAGGQRVVDRGTRILISRLPDGSFQGIRAHVGKVVKGLMCLKDAMQQGHRIVFDNDELTITHKSSGRIQRFDERNRVFELDLDIIPFKLLPPTIQKRISEGDPHNPFQGLELTNHP